MRKVLSVVAVLVMAGVVSAAQRSYDVSTAAIVGPETSMFAADLLVTESWGFEGAEGFAPGFIGGQAGWTVFTASTAEAHIETANPHSGTQHMRISDDPAVADGTLLGAFSPNVADPIVDASSMSVWVNIGATGGADYDVVPQAPSQGFLTARVKFEFDGDILVLDDTGGGLAFVDTGANWTPGTYAQLVIDVDPVGDAVTYSYGGALIYTSVTGIVAGTVIEQIVFLSDAFNLSESGDFDDLFIDRGSVPVEMQSFNVE